jgi:hypothetical protein
VAEPLAGEELRAARAAPHVLAVRCVNDQVNAARRRRGAVVSHPGSIPHESAALAPSSRACSGPCYLTRRRGRCFLGAAWRTSGWCRRRGRRESSPTRIAT